jgi:hypothetical protein
MRHWASPEGEAKMIEHRYINASDNEAQWYADKECDRQEVTADWYLENMCDEPLWLWLDGQTELGLDPWRLIDGPPSNPEARIFVQRRDMRRLGIIPEKTVT